MSTLKLIEIKQAGDVYLCSFDCPECRLRRFQGLPLTKCSNCQFDLSAMVVSIPARRSDFVLLAGTKRKKIVSQKLILKILRGQCHQCAYCDVDLKEIGFHIDHVKPLAAGGDNTEQNLVASCAPCNLKAASLVFSGYRHKREYLRKVRGIDSNSSV